MLSNLFKYIVGWEAAVKNVEIIGERIRSRGILQKAKNQLIVALCGQITAIYVVIVEVKIFIDSNFIMEGSNSTLIVSILLFMILTLIICITLYRLSLYFVLRIYDEANEYSLLHEPLFTYPFILAYNISIYFAYVVSQSYNFKISIEGLKLFVEIYQPLVSILGGIGIFMTFIALINRSELTSKQIVIANEQYKEAQNQNTFTNYFKHLEEFVKYMVNQSTMFGQVSEPRSLHGVLYGTFTQFHYEISQETIVQLKEQSEELRDLANKIFKYPNNVKQSDITSLINITDWIEKKFQINPFDDYQFTTLILPEGEHTKEFNLPVKFTDLGNLIRHRVCIIDYVYKFSNKSSICESFDSLLHIGVPHDEDGEFVYVLEEVETVSELLASGAN
jgi:hypothetical protein